MYVSTQISHWSHDKRCLTKAPNVLMLFGFSTFYLAPLKQKQSWSYMEERKARSSSRKPLECLYIWEQLTQSGAVILQQAWKQVVPVTSTRCATECFCIKPPSVQGCIAALPSQTDLHPLGLSGYVLHHLNLEDRRGERVTCERISALLWTILPFSTPSPNPFPVQLLVRFIRWVSCAPSPALGEKPMPAGAYR